MKNTVRLFPFFRWWPLYTGNLFRHDLLAGITLAFFVIPEAMAYASLAGLPPQTGIYCYLFAGLIYFLFGTSRQIAIGPTSAISMVIGASIGILSGGNPLQATMIASATAIFVAILFLIAYLIRFSALTNFISDTILTGFKAGAALAIASTQIPKLFGFTTQGDNFFERIAFFFLHLGDTHLFTMIFGLTALATLILAYRFLPGKPVSLAVVLISILLVVLTPVENIGLKMTGALPHGYRIPELPEITFSLLKETIGLAMACFFLAYIETVSAARAIARKNGYEIDPRQELLALGVVNLAVGAGGGYPSAGGLSQSTVNDRSGARSPFSLLITSALLLLFLFFFTGVTGYLPEVMLPVIVLHAIGTLVNIKEMKHLHRVSRSEFFIMSLSILAVLIFGILNGLLISMILSVVFLLKNDSAPHIAILGKARGGSRMTDILRHPENTPIPGLLILRVEASILYFNVPYLREHIRGLIDKEPEGLKMVIFDLSSSNALDVAGARYLIDLKHELNQRNIELRVVEAIGSVRDILRAEGLEKEIGHISRKVTLEEVVEAAIRPSVI